jgi:signal peptide peptidase SppA
MQPERFDAWAAVLQRRAAGEHASADVLASVRADAQQRAARRSSASGASSGGVLVLPIYGVVTQRGNALDDASGSGSVSTQLLSRALRDAVADDTVGAIILDTDSPGGSVYGVGELADAIYQARAKKPIIAFANSLMASAAYWLGASATEVHITPGGEIGSIGCLAAHEDWSRFNEIRGVRTTYITAGKFKAEGNSDEPLSSDARAYFQSRIDDYYSQFTRAVARGRGVPVATVRSDAWGGGRVLGAKAALDARMVDGISMFYQVVARARSYAKSPGTARASALSVAAAAARQRELDILKLS